MVEKNGVAASIFIHGVACKEYDIPTPDPEVVHAFPPPKGQTPQADSARHELSAGLKATGESEGGAQEATDGPRTHVCDTNISKFVEIESGAAFGIECRVHPDFEFRGFNTIVYHISMDGIAIAGQVLFSGDAPLYKASVMYDKIIIGDGKSAQTLKFGQIAVRDAIETDDIHGLRTRLVKLGTITVKVFRANCVVDRKSSDWITPESLTDGGIPETALKGRALSSGAGFGDVIQLKGPTIRKAITSREPLDVAIFHVRYRTRNDLQILGVIPRSPSPAGTDDEDLDNMTPEELRALVRKTKAKQDINVPVKLEETGTAFGTDSAGAVSGQAMRGVKRPRAPTIEGEDDLEVIKERVVNGKTRLPPHVEVIDISD